VPATVLPPAFVQRMHQQLGDEAEAFFNSLSTSSPVSIRLHHKKGNTEFALTDHVPWCDTGYYLETRPSFHLDPHWHGGGYYVQEASSMILDAVIRQLSLYGDSKIWLDLCAAPGGKTGILAKHLGPGDVLIANEVIAQRKSILYENLIKGGYLNTFISGEKTNNFPADFADVILIDAPCAGEGMMRKEPEAINQWSEGLVRSCAVLQKDIVNDAVKTLKPGGWLVYSTCSYSPDENIDNVLGFLRQHPLEVKTLQFDQAWNVTSLQKEDAVGYQLFPHKVRGEGLFISILQKRNNAQKKPDPTKKQNTPFQSVPASIAEYVHDPTEFLIQKKGNEFQIIAAAAESAASRVLQRLPKAELISQILEQKGKDFIPSHFMAMAGIVSPTVSRVDLNLKDALDYLERKTPVMDTITDKGWHLASFHGTLLGWTKHTPQGCKNYYPMNWRLRNRP